MPTDLPEGVILTDLEAHDGVTGLHDRRASDGIEPVQWNAVRSRAGALRGVHCHHRHADLLHVAIGSMRLGLCDLRGPEPVGTCITLTASRPQTVVIPTGVAHGFLFIEPSLHVYAVDHTWDLADELGCRWDDPGLGVDWGHPVEQVSGRDAALGSLGDLRASLAAVVV